MLANTRVTSITPERVHIEDAKGESASVAADSVILAIGTEANRELADVLERSGCTVHLIGDASGVGYIDGAMREAAQIAREL